MFSSTKNNSILLKIKETTLQHLIDPKANCWSDPSSRFRKNTNFIFVIIFIFCRKIENDVFLLEKHTSGRISTKTSLQFMYDLGAFIHLVSLKSATRFHHRQFRFIHLRAAPKTKLTRQYEDDWNQSFSYAYI